MPLVAIRFGRRGRHPQLVHICGFLGLGLCRSLLVHGNSLSFVAWGAGGADRFRRMDRV